MNNNTINFLNLQDLIVTSFQENNNSILITAKTNPTPQRCPRCGCLTSYIHGYRKQIFKDLPMRLKSVQISLSKRRYICKSCNKTFFENYSFLSKYNHFTSRTYLGIYNALSSERSIKSIASDFSCSSSTVLRMLNYAPSTPKRFLPTCLGIDEFKGNTDGEKYHCVLIDLENGTVFDVLPTRKKSDLIDYFKQFPNRNEVECFVMDMTNNYRSLSFLFPNAVVIADRFHYTRQVYWALDKVRKETQKSFSRGKRIYFKHSRKLLFAEYDKLKPESKMAVDVMLAQNWKLYEAWELKECFRYFRKATTKEEAERELHIWILQAEESGIKEYGQAITALRNWNKEVLNSVLYKYSNGRTEGFNNKIKVIKRNAYGYRNFEHFKKRILLHCQKNGNQATT